MNSNEFIAEKSGFKKSVCHLCGGSLEILVIPARLIGATYPESDEWKGDEHLIDCPICLLNA